MTWVPGSYDPDLNLIFWPTGNPGPWNGSVRPGKNIGTSSIIAFDGDTGAIKAQFQFVPHDMWDYDNIAQPMLVDITKDAQQRLSPRGSARREAEGSPWAAAARCGRLGEEPSCSPQRHDLAPPCRRRTEHSW